MCAVFDWGAARGEPLFVRAAVVGIDQRADEGIAIVTLFATGETEFRTLPAAFRFDVIGDGATREEEKSEAKRLQFLSPSFSSSFASNISPSEKLAPVFCSFERFGF